MGAHNNVHIPGESWPGWTWYAIEFGIVLAAAMVVSWKVSDAILPQIASAAGHGAALESWAGITIHSDEFGALAPEIRNRIETASNWAFYGILGAVFLGWYILIRGFALKKRVLG